MINKENSSVSKPTNSCWFHLKIETANMVDNPLVIWGVCFLLSSIYLLICTKSSPLYPLNDWVDANAFFTVGKGMMNGKVPYRDLFEQKGVLLYFIHGLAYLISNRSFLGVYLFEVISFSIFLFFTYKTLSLYIDRKFSLIYLPIITTAILNLRCFSHGDSAEEFCLPLLVISFYNLLHYFKIVDPKPILTPVVFWNGVIAGCVFWIKYSMTGFWIGWIAAVFFWLLFRKQYRRSIMAVLFFLGGMTVSTFPWVVYFGLNHSIAEWIGTYVIINITSYSISTTFLSRLLLPIYAISNQFYFNPIFNGVLWLGIIVFIRYGKFIKSRLQRILLMLCILFLVLGIYGGGRWYVYYYLILPSLIVLGVIVLHALMMSRINKKITLKSAIFVILITLLITIPATLRFNQNTRLLKIKKEDLVQYQYAAIINQSKNATLLNYGFLDYGFYTTTGITPNIKFFEEQNILYSLFPLNVDEQNRYIRDKTVEYIVLRQPASEPVENLDAPYLFENYTLIRSDNQEYEQTEQRYFLFQVRR